MVKKLIKNFHFYETFLTGCLKKIKSLKVSLSLFILKSIRYEQSEHSVRSTERKQKQDFWKVRFLKLKNHSEFLKLKHEVLEKHLLNGIHFLVLLQAYTASNFKLLCRNSSRNFPTFSECCL